MNQEIQQNITNLYNLIDDFDNTRDLLEIRYWLLNSNLGYNNNFFVARFNIEKQKAVVTRYLTQLSESVDDLEIYVHRCKQLVLVEKEKDPKFAKAYPHLRYKPDHVGQAHFDGSRYIHAYFDTLIDTIDSPTGGGTDRYLSEDYMFCQLWRKIGGQIWLCPWMRTDHIGTYHFRGDMPAVANYEIGRAHV